MFSLGFCCYCNSQYTRNRLGEGLKGGIILFKSIEHFIFQSAEEGFHNAVVVTVALSGHAYHGCILRAAGSEIVGLKWDAIDFENKKISIQHTVVTAKVNGTVTEIVRDKTKTKSSCRTLPLIPACEQMLNNWDTVTSTQQATFIYIWISPVRYLMPMPSSGSSRRRQKCENEPDAGDKKEKQPKILRF